MATFYAEVFNQEWCEKILAKLRPYSDTLNAWVVSEYQDESRLLRGQALQDAQAWTAGKSLGDLDYQFLAASQDLDKRDFQKRLEAEEQAKQILAEANRILIEANQKANRRIRIGIMVLVVTLVAAALAGLWATRRIKESWKVNELNQIRALCLYNTLQGGAADVINKCEKAVALAPNYKRGYYQDARGIARAMMDDKEGAIADFQAYIAWKNASKRKSPQDKQDILVRQKWINTLRAGKNPITAEEIKKLLK
ncbi:MAG: hypothetical protein KME38_10220 [Spirirestis rafaelensis WJT71-NPBG6]|jgi:hypothetical protein|nr:hypothetical protein [Spirirestis rafaelensis WJT71-NPBG6]